MHRFVWFLALSSCSPSQQPPSYYGQQPGQPDPQAQQAPNGMTCMGLFSCLAACTEGECIQGCLGQADPQTQAAATAFLQCGSSRCENAGGECLQTECQTEMAACSGANAVAAASPQQAPQYQPPEQQEQLVYPDQPHTTANLLPWMTGEWIGTNHQFTFYGDGRVHRSSGTPQYSTTTGDYKCVSTINEEGTVRQEGDLLIMEFPPAAGNSCGNKEQLARGLTVRYKITWDKYSDMPTLLLLYDIDCDQRLMSCNDKMRRR